MAGALVVIDYKAAAEWDGRLMEIVVPVPSAEWLAHWRWFWYEGRHQVSAGAKVWVPSGSYDGQPAREWYLLAGQITGLRVELAEAVEAPVAVQDDLFGEPPAA